MPKEKKTHHEVIVGNIGTVYSGDKAIEASAKFDTYVADSKSGVGRAGDEPVTWMRDGEIHQEFHPVTVHLQLIDAPHGRTVLCLATWLEEIAKEIRSDINKRQGSIVGQKWKITEATIEKE